MTIIKSFSFSQHQIIHDIMDLHTGLIQCDVTFGSGCFYKKGIPRPEFCFDLAPRRPGVIAADVRRLPIKNGVLCSMMLDLPFMARTGPGAKLKERFGELIGTIKDLWNFYEAAMQEIHRVLKPKGWLIFKLQNGVLSGINNNTYREVCNRADVIGFKWVDEFVLLATHRMTHPAHKRQLHARKFHSFFVVFKKR